MKSPSVVLPNGVHVPRIRHAPHVRANAWEDVVELSASYGLKLFEWQENVLEAAMGERADGMWAAKHIGVSCPRQNGKGAFAVAREYIRLRNGQEVRFVTRSKSAIRGFSADLLMLDEAQILNDLQWEAILY